METKFKRGDRVTPISKSIGDPFSKSVVWGEAKEIGQPYLYVREITSDRIICTLNPSTSENGGDYFLEEDLIFYEEAFIPGEIVEVRASEGADWTTRCFLAKIKDKFVCVQGELHERQYANYLSGQEFKVFQWPLCRKVEFTPVKVKLNDKYDAVINKNEVVVGCQNFKFNAIEELYEAIQRVKKL